MSAEVVVDVRDGHVYFSVENVDAGCYGVESSLACCVCAASYHLHSEGGRPWLVVESDSILGENNARVRALEARLPIAYLIASLSSHCARSSASTTKATLVAAESSSSVVIRYWLRNGWRGVGALMAQGCVRIKLASSLRGR